MMRKWLLFAPLVAVASLVVPARAQEERVAELERKVDVLMQEIERIRLGAVAETTSYAARPGFAPGASKVYGIAKGLSIGGYGEMLAQRPDRKREDDVASGGVERLDFLRAVFYIGHKFSDELLFNSEVELEHAGVTDEGEASVDPTTHEGEAVLSGEVTLEFAYLDWSARRAFGVRAGKLLVPMGFINEQHEPPVFLGARRPETERLIIPATWGANGAGVYGQLYGGRLDYRAYVIEGLDAGHFSPSSSIRGGRQGGHNSVMRHPAWVGRVDWTPAAGLTVGGSGFIGNSLQGAPPAAPLKPTVTLFDAHGRYSWRRIDARALYAQGALDDAAALSDFLGLVDGANRLGERFFGGYVEASVDVTPGGPMAKYRIFPYVRYEELDTQDKVAAPDSENGAFHRKTITIGVAFQPDPNVVIKADREERRNSARTETSQWNLAIGYLF